MALNIPADGFEIGMIMTRVGDAEKMEWTFGIGTDGDEDLGDVGDGIAEAWNDDLSSITSSVMTLVKVAFTAGAGLVHEQPANFGGAATADVLPSNCAVLVKKLTGLPGRAHRGRFYYPSVGIAVTDSNGMINPTSVSALQGAFNSFFDDVTSLDHVQTISLFHTGTGEPDAVTSLVVENQIATQRRRMRP